MSLIYVSKPIDDNRQKIEVGNKFGVFANFMHLFLIKGSDVKAQLAIDYEGIGFYFSQLLHQVTNSN